MMSGKVATTVPTFCITKGKKLAVRQFQEAYEDAFLKPDLLMIYKDGPPSEKGTAVAWMTKECGMTEGSRAFATPSI